MTVPKTIIAFLLVLYHSTALPANTGKTQPLVIAYYSGNISSIDKYPVEKLTHIIYSFVHLKGNRLYVSSTAGAILQKLVSLKKRNAALKIALAFAGWGGCKTCSAVFSTAEGRNAFAQSVKKILQRYKLDGIDLDWEYPAIQGPVGHPFAPTDQQHFTALVKTLRNVLGNAYEISFAAGAFTEYLENSVEWKKVMAVADRVHLMTYDLVNRNSVFTGHHAALYATAFQKESTDNAIRYLDSLKIPRHKIVTGVAFYARVYTTLKNNNNGLYQPCRFQRFEVFRNHPAVFTRSNGFTFYWDEEAKAPYYFSAAKNTFATFDNVRSARLKAQYAIDKGLAGIMFWELRQDDGKNSLLNAIVETFRRNATTVHLLK